jgi:hypothetical protein
MAKRNSQAVEMMLDAVVLALRRVNMAQAPNGEFYLEVGAGVVAASPKSAKVQAKATA